MTTERVLVFMIGDGRYDRSVVAAFSVSDMERAIEFLKERGTWMTSAVAHVWDGDQFIGYSYGVVDLLDGRVVTDDGDEVPLTPNRRKRSSKRRR